MSSMCSVPMDRRMVLGRMPWSASSCSVSWLMGRGGRVDDQTLDVRDVGEQGEDLAGGR